MRALVLLLIGLVSISLAHSCSAQPPFGKARLSAKTLGVPGGSCSGTAVRRYVILTASHCLPDGYATVITVNGQQCEVWKVVHDGRDHALVTVDESCPQKHYSRIRKSRLVAGDSIFVWGNPGVFRGLLRTGMIAGDVPLRDEVADELEAPRGTRSLLFAGAFGRGDSGAGVFNERGQLVGVLSWGSMGLTYPPHLFTGMLPMNFSKAQLRAMGL